MPVLVIRAESVDELVALNADIHEVRERALDFTPAFAAGIDPILTDELLQQFATEGAHFGDPWAPLAPRTIAARQRPGHGRGGILRDTDAMYNAFVNPFDSGAIRIVEPQRYQRGVATEYYPYHHDGTLRMPARPVVPDAVPAELKARLEDVLRTYLLTGAVEAVA